MHQKQIVCTRCVLIGNQVKILNSPAAVSSLYRSAQTQKATVRRHSRVGRQSVAESKSEDLPNHDFKAFEERAENSESVSAVRSL